MKIKIKRDFRTTIFLVVGLCVFSACSNKEETADKDRNGDSYKVSVSVLHVRHSPSISSRIVAKLKIDQKIMAMSVTDKCEIISSQYSCWIKVSFQPQAYGYVFGAYLKPKGKPKNVFIYTYHLNSVFHNDASYQGDKEWELTPGKSAGLIRLGTPVSTAVMVEMGRPTSIVSPGETPDSGSIFWKNRILVKLHDGKEPKNVVALFIKSKRYATPNGIHIGSSESELKKLYPKAKRFEDVMDADYGYYVPGMSFWIYKNTVTGIVISK